MIVVTGVSRQMKLPIENQLRTKLPFLYHSESSGDDKDISVNAGGKKPIEDVIQAMIAIVVSAKASTLVRIGIISQSEIMYPIL